MRSIDSWHTLAFDKSASTGWYQRTLNLFDATSFVMRCQWELESKRKKQLLCQLLKEEELFELSQEKLKEAIKSLELAHAQLTRTFIQLKQHCNAIEYQVEKSEMGRDELRHILSMQMQITSQYVLCSSVLSPVNREQAFVYLSSLLRQPLLSGDQWFETNELHNAL